MEVVWFGGQGGAGRRKGGVVRESIYHQVNKSQRYQGKTSEEEIGHWCGEGS